jgi:ketosteroid isomerase-like protein
MNANEEAVAAVLAKYQDALNQSDTEAVMKLYAAAQPFQYRCRCGPQSV